MSGSRSLPGASRAGGRHRRAGTAVSEKGLERSEAILDAATEILVGEGHAQLSMRKIAVRAGIRLGNLQYYYATKQDVVRALLERTLARSLASIEAKTAATTGTPSARLRTCLEAVLEDQADQDCCRMFWEVWALAARDRSVARATRAFYERYRDGLAVLLHAVAPRLGAERTRRRATLVVAMLEGATVFRLGAPRDLPPDLGLAHEICDLVDSHFQENPT